MKITTPSQTPRVTQTPIPYFRPEPLRKRGETICGDLKGAYSGIQAPICSGVTSICTFTNSLQACCDNSGSCQSYTTCNGGRSPITCSDSHCLKCPSASPYCIKYNFYDANSGDYNGYSCGDVDLQGVTIQGAAIPLTAGYVTSSFTTTRQPSADTASALSRSTSTGSSTSPTTAASSESASGSGSDHHSSSTGIIAGSIGGGVVLALVIAFLLYKCKRGRRSRTSGGPPRREMQQRVRY